jgi:hypothetical protein
MTYKCLSNPCHWVSTWCTHRACQAWIRYKSRACSNRSTTLSPPPHHHHRSDLRLAILIIYCYSTKTIKFRRRLTFSNDFTILTFMISIVKFTHTNTNVFVKSLDDNASNIFYAVYVRFICECHIDKQCGMQILLSTGFVVICNRFTSNHRCSCMKNRTNLLNRITRQYYWQSILLSSKLLHRSWWCVTKSNTSLVPSRVSFSSTKIQWHHCLNDDKHCIIDGHLTLVESLSNSSRTCLFATNVPMSTWFLREIHGSWSIIIDIGHMSYLCGTCVAARRLLLLVYSQ